MDHIGKTSTSAGSFLNVFCLFCLMLKYRGNGANFPTYFYRAEHSPSVRGKQRTGSGRLGLSGLALSRAQHLPSLVTAAGRRGLCGGRAGR